MTKPLVLVVGMHRSGTSLAMQALERLGAGFGGQLLAADKFNPNGYFEAPESIAFHDDLLSDLEKTWGSPEHGFSIDPTMFEEEVCLAHIETATSILSERLEHTDAKTTLALKDPRASLFLPIWINAARALNLDPRIAICVRHPAEVAKSLEERDKLSRKLSELYWLTYISSAFRYSRGCHRERLIFSDWITEPTANFRKLKNLLPTATVQIDEPVFDSGKSDRTSELEKPSAYLDRWWKVLTDENSSDEDIDRLAGQHIDASFSLQGAATAIRAEIGETTPYLLDRDLQNYRKQLAELTKKYNADQSWISEQSKALADLQVSFNQIAEDRDRLAGRAKELLAAYQTAEAQVTDLHAELKKTGHERDAQVVRAQELLTAYQKSENMLEGLQTSLAQTTKDRDRLAGRAKELLTAYQTAEAQVTGLHAELKKTGHERDAQVARALEMLGAYQKAETHIENLQTALENLTAERDTLTSRSQELLAAYQNAETRISALEASLAETTKERDFHSDQERELLAALQSEREANELLRQKLRRLNPLKWFRT